MNFSKSILALALLVSVSAASAFPGAQLATQVRTSVVNFADEAAFHVASNAKAVWACVPSKVRLQVIAQYRLNQVTSTVAPFLTKKNAAIAAAAGVVTTGAVVAYNKGLFGKAAKAVVNGVSAVTAKFASKK